MGLVIPDGYQNWIITVNNNSGGGLSSRSSFAIGLGWPGTYTQVIVDRVANIFRDQLKIIWDAGWSVGPCHVIEGAASPPNNVWDNTTEEVGTASASVYSPPAVSAIVSKQTGIQGRAFRGRIFVPGVVESSVDEDGSITSGALSAYQTIFDDLQTALIADAAVDELVLFHDEDSSNAGLAHTVDRLLVRNIVGTMRPRQRR